LPTGYPPKPTDAFHSRSGELSTAATAVFDSQSTGFSRRHSPALQTLSPTAPHPDARGGDLVKIRFTPPPRTPAIYRAPKMAPPIGQMEPHIKSPRLRTWRAENSENKQGEFSMKKITAAVALMCALSAYVSYPSATVSGGTAPSLALSMQESRSLPMEAYDAV
jgi:hypothetical protein